jgi:hypothetical protein
MLPRAPAEHHPRRGIPPHILFTKLRQRLSEFSYIYRHVYVCDCRRGFGLDIGFIDHFNTQLISISNYSAITNLHTLQITAANTKSSPTCSFRTSRFLITASNIGDSSASALKSTLNGGSLPTDLVAPVVFLITSRHGPRRQH